MYGNIVHRQELYVQRNPMTLPARPPRPPTSIHPVQPLPPDSLAHRPDAPSCSASQMWGRTPQQPKERDRTSWHLLLFLVSRFPFPQNLFLSRLPQPPPGLLRRRSQQWQQQQQQSAPMRRSLEPRQLRVGPRPGNLPRRAGWGGGGGEGVQ